MGRPTNPGLPPSSAPGSQEKLLRVQGQRAIGLIEASELRESLWRRDTSKATLPFGSRSTGQQIRVLDAADEEFGEASAGVATAKGAAARPCRGEWSKDNMEVVRYCRDVEEDM